MRGSTGGSQWAPPSCVPNTYCCVDWTHNVQSWHLSSSAAEDIWSEPLCLQIEHLIRLYLNRTEPITVCQVQAERQQQLGFQELQEFTEENQMLPEGLHTQRGMSKGRAVHSPFTADVTTSSKMSFTTSWAPSSVPTYTPNTNTDRVFPGKERKEEIMAMVF